MLELIFVDMVYIVSMCVSLHAVIQTLYSHRSAINNSTPTKDTYIKLIGQGLSGVHIREVPLY